MSLEDFRSDKLEQRLLSMDKKVLEDEVYYLTKEVLALDDKSDITHVLEAITGIASRLVFQGKLTELQFSTINRVVKYALADIQRKAKLDGINVSADYLSVILTYYQHATRDETYILNAIESKYTLGTILDAKDFCERFSQLYSTKSILRLTIFIAKANYLEYLNKGMSHSQAYEESCKLFHYLVERKAISKEDLASALKIYSKYL